MASSNHISEEKCFVYGCFFMNILHSVLLVDLSRKSHKDRSWFTGLMLMISDNNYQPTINEDWRFCDLPFVISSCCWNSGRLSLSWERFIYYRPCTYVYLYLVMLSLFASYFSQPVFCLMQNMNTFSVQTMWWDLMSCKIVTADEFERKCIYKISYFIYCLFETAFIGVIPLFVWV